MQFFLLKTNSTIIKEAFSAASALLQIQMRMKSDFLC
jgi:hypothetical protein